MRPSFLESRSTFLGRIDAFQNIVKVATDARVAFAGEHPKSIDISDAYAPAPCFDDPFRLQILNDPAEIAAPDPQHRRQLFLRQRYVSRAGPIHGSQQPFRRSLFD